MANKGYFLISATHLLGLLVLNWFVSEVLLVNPGAKIQISPKALNYGANVAVNILSQSIYKAKIPDQKGSAHVAVGKVDYEIRNIRVTSFQKPGTTIRLDVGKGLTWYLGHMNVAIHGDWSYRYKMGFIKIRDHGSFDGYVSGVSGSISVTLGQNSSSGGVTISSTGCSISVLRVKIKLHGGASWFYNLFDKQIEKPIRNNLQAAICKQARNAVDVEAAKELATQPVSVVILNDWLLDYRLVSPPVFTTSFLQSAHKAEFFHVNDRSEAPFQADVIPDTPPVDRMVTIWLSDYILNTVGYALYKRRVLNHTLTAKDLPPESRGYLDTKCRTTKICFGTFIPEVQRCYPNASVELEVTASESPKALISTQGVLGQALGRIIHRARLSNGSLAYLFTANISVIISVIPRLDGSIIKGEVSQLKPAINITESSVGPISGNVLTDIFNLMSKLIIVPALNAIGDSGFSLPVIKHVQLLNTNITSVAHSLCLTADIIYSK